MTELKTINEKVDNHLFQMRDINDLENKKKDILSTIVKMREQKIDNVEYGDSTNYDADLALDINSNNAENKSNQQTKNVIEENKMQYIHDVNDLDMENYSVNTILCYKKDEINNINLENSEWTPDIEKLLYTMQEKSLELSKIHKSKYIKYQKISDHFKIPIIILSSVATFFNFGMQPYLEQNTISVICSCLTFITGLLGTIELYLQIQKKMEKSLTLSKDLFMNSMSIYKILCLDENRRKIEALVYLNNRYETFRQIIEKSDIMPDNDILPPLHFFNKNYRHYNNDLCNALDEHNNHKKNMNYLQENIFRDNLEKSISLCCCLKE